jgi:hypothetical protein
MDVDMRLEALCRALEDEFDSGDYHDNVFGEYHPSSITGCPLGEFLDWMLEEEPDYNHYMFSGTAVHYYLQESGMLTNALNKVGFNPMYTAYEVLNKVDIGDGVKIIGKVDCLATCQDSTIAIDLKYSSLKPGYDSGRIMKYMSQVNTYANMFNCDYWCLLMIYSKADDMTDAVDFIVGETDEENYELVKERARNIHEALDVAGYPSGNRWDKDVLKARGPDFWEKIMRHFNEDHVPAYDGELKYSDRDEWVLPYQDDWRNDGRTSGFNKFKGGE